LLLAFVSTVCRYPVTVLAVSLLLSALSIVTALTTLQYHTQRNDLLSAHKDYQKRWQRYLDEFGDDDDMVVVVRGTDRTKMEQALEAVAARIREQPTLFNRLFYKVDLRHLHDRALMLLPVEQIADIRRSLEDMNLLLELGPLAWRGLGLLNLLQEAQFRLAHRKPGPLSESDQKFFTQLLAVTRSAAAMVRDPAHYTNPWSSMTNRPVGEKDQLAEPQYFFNNDETLAFLLVRPIKEKESFTAALRSVSAMRKILAEVREQFPLLDLGLTGMPVLETDEMAAAGSDTSLASWLAIVGAVLLFFVVYRGIAYPLLTIATLLIGTSWAMGWTTLTVGHLNILSATFAIMLIGMGDYGVLWVMRYEHARREGLSVREALLHTTEHEAIGNLTAASTLALAFFAAILADFKAVAELGWIAGCGVILCALACFTVLPAILMLCDRRVVQPRTILSLRDHVPETWLAGFRGRPTTFLTVAAVAVLALVSCGFWVTYDHNLLHLQAQNLDSVRWEMDLIEHTAGASWHALSICDTPEAALALKARLEQLPEVSRVVEVATLVPPRQQEKMALLEAIRHKLRCLPQRGQTIPHSQPNVATVVRLAREAQSHLHPEDVGLLGHLYQALGQLEEQVGMVREPATAALRLQMFDQQMTADLAEDLHRLADVSHPVPITLDDLPPDMRDRQVSKSGKWLLRVFARDCLWDFEPLEHFVQEIRKVDPEATGKPFGTVEGLKAMKDGLQRAGVYAFLVIAAVLLLDFRRVGHTLVALAPLILGVLLTLGIVGLIGMPLNPANMIAFPLILGVGVDNGVHILHDWLIRRREGKTSISYAIGRGVLVKALTSMVGFGTLMISTERGLAGLGFLLTVGVCCSMISALFLLPMILNLVPARRPAAFVVPPLSGFGSKTA
jgi:hopanoid biosynthesis associated RND transporter like protein HpnN